MGTTQRRPLRIGIGGFAIECCTFSLLDTTLDDFTVLRGDEMRELYPFLPGWTWRDRTEVTFVPCLRARAIPGGQVTAEAYQRLKDDLFERVVLPLDGFFFYVHGAMSVIGLDDAEADLAAGLREIVGPDCVISAGMDLHGNVSERLVSQIDIFTCYREAPHIDELATKERAVRLLVDCLDQGIRPYRAWVRIPVMLPGERTSTVVEPGKTVYGKLTEADAVEGVIDPSLWVGYVWADQPRNSATVVVTGTDVDAISREAERIARRYWEAREDFGFEVTAGPPDEVIEAALALNQKAVFISDSGDNITAGGAGDITLMLTRLLARDDLLSGQRTAIVAALPSAAAVERCLDSGVGTEVTLTIGGVLDPVNGFPVDLTGTVTPFNAPTQSVATPPSSKPAECASS